MWVCRLPVHIAPAECTVFAVIFGRFATSSRADVGIGPYKGSPWAQGADSPYQGEMARRAKEGRDAGPKGLRGFERRRFRTHSESCDPSPPSFSSKMPPPLPARGAARGGFGRRESLSRSGRGFLYGV